MTADEPMSTPDSGELREAMRRLLDDEVANLADDGARLSHAVVRRMEAVLAAHSEPVPTPDSVARVARVLRHLAERMLHGTEVADEDLRATVDNWAGGLHGAANLLTPDSADDATVGEREGCAFGCTTHDCRFPCDAGADPSDGVWNSRTRHWYCPLGNDNCGAHFPATPPADDANRAPVSGGLDEGEREALADSIGAELYASLMEASADQWRRWEFMTVAAKEKYRAEGGRIVTAALVPAVERILAARDAAWVERLAAERDTARREAGERIAQAIEAHPSPHLTRIYAARIARADALTSDDGSGV